LRASPWEGGFLSVDFGYLSDKYGSYSYADPTNPSNVIDNTNTTIADLTPKWTLTVGIEHEFVLSNGASITPRLNIYAQDNYDYRSTTRDAPPSPCNQPSYTKVGARVTYAPSAGDWHASLYGYNLTDETIYSSCGASRGVYRYRYERPRWWGVEFEKRWGTQ
jgi:outer membrane receptor protein involved in Fe transport